MGTSRRLAQLRPPPRKRETPIGSVLRGRGASTAHFAGRQANQARYIGGRRTRAKQGPARAHPPQSARRWFRCQAQFQSELRRRRVLVGKTRAQASKPPVV